MIFGKEEEKKIRLFIRREKARMQFGNLFKRQILL